MPTYFEEEFPALLLTESRDQICGIFEMYSPDCLAYHAWNSPCDVGFFHELIHVVDTAVSYYDETDLLYIYSLVTLRTYVYIPTFIVSVLTCFRGCPGSRVRDCALGKPDPPWTLTILWTKSCIHV